MRAFTQILFVKWSLINTTYDILSMSGAASITSFQFWVPFFFLMWWKILATLSMLCCCLFLFFFHSSHILYEHNYSQCRLTCIINYHFAHNTHTHKALFPIHPGTTITNSSKQQQRSTTNSRASNQYFYTACNDQQQSRAYDENWNEWSI